MSKTYLCWSHGQDAAPWGSKNKAMAEVAKGLDLELDTIDYRGVESPDERTSMLVERIRTKEGRIILAGSSMGGYVSASAAQEVALAGLFLVAPAFYLPGYDKHMFFNLPETLHIVHGWKDEVVPAENSIRFAKRHSATLHMLNADHRISDKEKDVAELFRIFLEKTAF